MSHPSPVEHPASPVGVLVSRTAFELVEARLSAAADAAGRRLRFEVMSDDEAASGDVEVAFYSRDLWAGSTLDQPSPASRRFFDALASSASLRWTHVCSAGGDLPIYRRLPARSRLTTSPGAAARPIAQSVVAAVLWKARQFPRWQAAQAARTWDGSPGVEPPPDLDRQTALIVGMGPIGLETGRLLRAIGLRVVGLSRTRKPSQHVDAVDTFEGIDAHLPSADWLVLACPLTESTARILNARRIDALPANCMVINVGRGGLIDEGALVRALQARRIAGAYLDVFETEPLAAESPLWGLPGVLVSPHGAGLSRGGPARVADLFVANFTRWIGGQALEHVFERPMTPPIPSM